MPALACPGCSRTLEVPAHLAGKKVRCPACASVRSVPATIREELPTPPPSPSNESPTLPPGLSGDDQTATLPPRPDPDTTVPPSGARPAGGRDGRAPPGYEILSELGRGGMGVVYKARQVALDRVVALKMVLAGAHASADELARFQTEAEAIARLQHAGIVAVYEVGRFHGMPFFSLEFCPGGGLDRKLGGKPTQPEDAAALVRRLAQAMQAAHDARVIHRDLKPANVLLAADGTPKVTDFGLAKKLDEQGRTQEGKAMGTPSYMAPEQAEGKSEVGPPADIYALGAILYECLTGRPPFRAATALDTILQVISEEAVPPRRLNTRVPLDLETICLKCLSKEPGKRYASAKELGDDLSRFLAGEPVTARRVGVVGRSMKWVRRNPLIAGMTALVTLSLVSGTAVSLRYALLAEGARQKEADRAAGEEQAKRDAEEARALAQRQLVDMHSAAGLTAAEKGDHSLALLWFSRAARSAPEGGEQDRLNRVRVANWRREVPVPRLAAAVPGFRFSRSHFRSFAFSPDGRHLLAQADMPATLLLDCRTLAQVPLSVPNITAACWEPRRGGLLVAGGEGVRLLGGPEFDRAEKIPSEGVVRVLSATADGRLVAWGGSAGVRVWDREASAFVTPVLPQTREPAALTFSASGGRLAVLTQGGAVRVYAVPSEKATPVVTVHGQSNGEKGVSHGGPDGVAPRFVRGGQDLLTVEGSRLIWREAATGKARMRADGPGEGANLIAFTVSPDGEQAAGVWASGGRLWAVADPPRVLASVPQTHEYAEDVSFSADGAVLVTCGQDTNVNFWSPAERKDFRVQPRAGVVKHPTQVVRARLSPDGSLLATAQWDGTVCLWAMPPGQPVAYRVSAGSACVPVVSPDGRHILASGTSFRNSAVAAVRVVAADGGEQAGQAIDPGGLVVGAAFSPDGRSVALACSAARTSTERRKTVFEPDGRGGNVQVWDWASGKRLAGPVPMPAEPRGVAWHARGGVAVVCADYRVLLLDASGKVRRELDPGTRTRAKNSNANLWRANGLACFGDDGKLLVTWEMSHDVHVWDVESGKLLHTLRHDSRIESVEFHPKEGRVLATAARDNAARVWDLATGKVLSRLDHPRFVPEARFSQGGEELITCCDDGHVRTWDWRAGRLRHGLPLPGVSIERFALGEGERWLVAGGLGGMYLADRRSRSLCSPKFLADATNLAVTVPPSDRRAVVGGFRQALVALDLEAMTTPAAGPGEELERSAELLAGRRILEDGTVVPLPAAEWLERWRRFKEGKADR